MEKQSSQGKRGKGINEFLKVQDLFTLLNAAFGVLSIFSSLDREYFNAVVFMLASVLCDYLDGKVGRKFREAHEFGKELDSLADIIAFGAAPAVFGYVYAGGGILLDVMLIIFVLCGALRLARFNVTNIKGAYQGMPITMNGLIIPLIYFVMLPVKYYFVVYLVSAALMIGSFKVKKII